MNLNTVIAKLQTQGESYHAQKATIGDCVDEINEIIVGTVPRGLELPRGYRLRQLRSNVGSWTRLENKDGALCGRGEEGYLHGDFGCWYRTSFTAGRQLLCDVADGWLDEVTAFLAEREAADANTVEKARAAMASA